MLVNPVVVFGKVKAISLLITIRRHFQRWIGTRVNNCNEFHFHFEKKKKKTPPPQLSPHKRESILQAAVCVCHKQLYSYHHLYTEL